MNKSESNTNEGVLPLIASAVFLVFLLYLAVAWPTLAWSTFRADPTIVNPGDAVGGAIRWLTQGADGDPRALRAFATYRETMPPPKAWIALNALGLAGLLALGAIAWARVDRWRGSRPVALASWSPRNRVTSRSWAKPRDLVHLRLRNNKRHRLSTGLTRLVSFNRRASDPAGGDSWPLGELSGRALRSSGESHLMAVAPTRSGKTTRVLVPALLDHDGPAVVLLNKDEVVRETLGTRVHCGPVWIYAPLSPAPVWEQAGWTPLLGCENWDQALRMGRWLFDADPGASASSNDSGGARFYNREAVAVALPPLLHAAALDGRKMADILGWLRSGIDGLDEPRAILSERSADAAANALAGIQAQDERPRSLLLMSAAQLIDAYRLPLVQRSDHPEFRPEELLGGGTLYIVAPDSDQELLAPIFGGLLGAVLRVFEQQAAGPRNPDRPLLRIFADEAAHLAPLSKLPAYLAVSAGWGVRWCLIYQSLAQLEHRYPGEADAVLGNVLCKLFLGPIQDATTRDYLIDLLDEETVTASSWRAEPLGAAGPRTRHERQSAKVSAQRLMQLGEGQAVMVHGRDLPAVTYLPACWEKGRGR